MVYIKWFLLRKPNRMSSISNFFPPLLPLQDPVGDGMNEAAIDRYNRLGTIV
jgi:hypothetical protein